MCHLKCVRRTSWRRHNIEKFLYPLPRLTSGGGRQVNPNHIVQDFVAVCQHWQEVGTPCHQWQKTTMKTCKTQKQRKRQIQKKTKTNTRPACQHQYEGGWDTLPSHSNHHSRHLKGCSRQHPLKHVTLLPQIVKRHQRARRPDVGPRCTSNSLAKDSEIPGKSKYLELYMNRWRWKNFYTTLVPI